MVLLKEVAMVLNMATLFSSLCINVSIGLNAMLPSDATENFKIKNTTQDKGVLLFLHILNEIL